MSKDFISHKIRRVGLLTQGTTMPGSRGRYRKAFTQVASISFIIIVFIYYAKFSNGPKHRNTELSERARAGAGGIRFLPGLDLQEKDQEKLNILSAGADDVILHNYDYDNNYGPQQQDKQTSPPPQQQQQGDRLHKKGKWDNTRLNNQRVDVDDGGDDQKQHEEQLQQQQQQEQIQQQEQAENILEQQQEQLLEQQQQEEEVDRDERNEKKMMMVAEEERESVGVCE